MTTVGAILLPHQPPERLREVAASADGEGLDELWLWEDCFWAGALTSASAALAWTTRVRVGVGVLPVPLRNPALAAMEVAALDRLFPGRAVVGVGHGVQDWMGRVGARVASPLTLLGEHLDALRALLAGERVTASGRYVRLDDVALDWPPPTAPPLLAGGEGPKTLHLTGARADGTILVAGTTPEGVARARTLVDAGRTEAGRSGRHPLVVFLAAATGPGAAERAAARSARCGWPSPADRVVVGDAGAVADQLQRWVEAGADDVVLQPEPEDDPVAFTAFAAEVAAALRG